MKTNAASPLARLVTLALALAIGLAGFHADARTLVATNSTWRYFKGTQEASTPTNAWRELAFDDSTWATGPAPFHYGTNAVGGDDNVTDGTILGDMRGNHTCVFLRQTFVIEDPGTIIGLHLDLWFDDGLAVWINGQPALQPLSVTSLAHDGRATLNREAFARSLSIDDARSLLRTGTNVLCLQAFSLGLADDDFRLEAGLETGMATLALKNLSLEVTEETNAVAVVVTRTGYLSMESTVEWTTADGTAIAGLDYVASSGTLTFHAGESNKTVLVPILNDWLGESYEQFTVYLRNAGPEVQVGQPRVLTVGIADNDIGIMLEQAFYQMNEDAGAVTVRVGRAGDPSQPASVEWLTLPGSAQAGLDYVASTGLITFAVGEVWKEVNVSILNDGQVESMESFAFRLRNPSEGNVLGTITQAIMLIVDNDLGVAFSGDTYAATEDVGVVTVDVHYNGTASKPVSVEWVTLDGTALAGLDYLASTGVVSFAAGETIKPISVAILNDGLMEFGEYFYVQLRNPSGAGDVLGVPAMAWINIAASDQGIFFEATPVSFAEYNEAVELAIRRDDVPLGPATVEWFTVPGTALAGLDYVASTGLVTFAAGETRQTIRVPLVNDRVPEATESFQVQLANVTGSRLGSPNPATVLIRDNDLGFAFELPTAEAAENSGFVELAIRGPDDLDAPASVGWFTIDGTAQAGSDYEAGSGQVTFAPGEQRQVIRIPILNDALHEGPQVFGVVLTNATSGVGLGALRQASVQIQDNDLGIFFSPSVYTVSESNQAVGIYLQRQDDLLQPVSVEWYTVDGTALAGLDYVAATGTVAFAAGETQKSLRMDVVLNDGLFEGWESFQVRLRNVTGQGGLGSPSQATINIQDNDRGLFFETGSMTVTENTGAVQLVIRRQDDLLEPVSVEWFTTNGSALASEDYVATNGLVTFEFGEPRKTVEVPILNDGRQEGLESFVVRLRTVTGQGSVGVPNQVTVFISDNDRGIFFTSPTSTFLENVGAAQLTVRRQDDWPEAVSVEWFTVDGTAVAGLDYVASTGWVTFAVGDVDQIVTIPILNDGVREGTELFTVRLADPTDGGSLGSPDQATIQIQDNDRGIYFATPSITISEINGTADLVIRRQDDLPQTAVVEWFTVDDTARNVRDFLGGTGQVAFAAGEEEKTVSIPIVNDLVPEPDETFTVQLRVVSDGIGLSTPSVVSVYIQSDEPLAPLNVPLLVWADSPNPTPPYTTWATAARNIQDAVEITWDGDTILVTNGVYDAGIADPFSGQSNRVALTKRVVLRSVNGPEVTTIVGAADSHGGNGAGAIRCVYVGANAILSGFTLSRGHAGGGGGGVFSEPSGTVTNCIVTGNSAGQGGGAYGGRLDNCRLTDNAPEGAFGATLRSCVSIGNRWGASQSTLDQCTVTGNTDGGVSGCTLYNSIVYFNQSPDQPNGPNHVGSSFQYSCTTPRPDGSGNIDADPQLVSADRPAPDSPCRGAGSAPHASGVDLAGQPWANPPSMGAYELATSPASPLSLRIGASATSVAPGFAARLTAFSSGPSTQSVWNFGDGTLATNQPLAFHAWTSASNYTVTLTGYNDSHPEGVSTTVVIEVLEAMHYVNVNNPTPVPPYTSWGTAATNIQDAIDAGVTLGRLVLVTNGVYRTGRVEANGTNRIVVPPTVRVQSVNGPKVTVIDGGGEVRCAAVGERALLSGLTLTGGFDFNRGGGVWSAASGVISNCVIADNQTAFCWRCSSAGGGVAGGILYNCILEGNGAPYGGGAYNSTLYDCILAGNSNQGGTGERPPEGGGAYSSTLYNCVVMNNSSFDGGGAYDSTLYNCVVMDNSSFFWGGGVSYSTLYNCVVTGNSAEYGGGADGSTLYNCTLTLNTATNAGGGILGGRLYNCVVYHNQALSGANHTGWGTFEYSCTTPLPEGPGNIDADPLFVTAYHLSTYSPCRGAGSPAYASGVDMDGEPWASPPSMGADEPWSGPNTGPITVHIASREPRIPVGHSGSLAALVRGRANGIVWDFGDGTTATNLAVPTHTWDVPGLYTVTLTAFNDTNPQGVSTTVQVEVIGSVHYVNAANPNPMPPYANWATAATSIQDAIDAGASDGRLVFVTNGVYRTGSVETNGTNRVLLTAETVLRSVNGPDVTVIDGGGEMRCAYLGSNSVLSGFTLRNGKADTGGGAYTEAPGAVVTNCVITGNSAGNGGGVFGGAVLVCTITNNTADNWGGGTFDCAVEHSLIARNRALMLGSFPGGGGAYGGTLRHCTVTDNLSPWGSGAAGSTLYNCTVTGNVGDGAAYESTLYNSVIANNVAPPDLGFGDCAGAYYSKLYNCTVTGNSAWYSAGAYNSALYNCIVYSNVGGNHEGCTFEYSCTTPLPGGPGNIDADPLLASLTHLSLASPCRGAGSVQYASGVDIDGERWANPPSMGADELVIGRAIGALRMSMIADPTNVAPGFVVQFTALNTGPITQSVWDFGNGTRLTNQPMASNVWTAPGTYTVKLIGYNDTYPQGVSAALEIEVIDAVHYVDAGNSNPVAPYTSWASAATNIQDAIEAGSTVGRRVLVTNGVYRFGRVEKDGINRLVVVPTVRVHSVNGPRCTHLDGSGEVRGANLGARSVLSGFTVTNCYEIGVVMDPTAVATNCVVVGNAFGVGGGTLDHCAVLANRGDGVSGSTLHHCAVANNSGLGAHGSSLHHCVVTGNRWGVQYSELNHCTVAHNAEAGVRWSSIRNSIVHFNGPAGNNANHEGSGFEYSCTTPRPDGPGNIDADPLFLDAAAGDYRLRADSPCIDAGTNLTETLTTDLLGLPSSLDGNADGVARVDMGAYEFNPYGFTATAQFTADGFAFTVSGEPGRTVRLERSRDLVHWEPAGEVTLPASGQMRMQDAVARTESWLFYRVIAVR